MAAIGLRGACRYGAKYLASLAVVPTLGGGLAGAGWYLATLAGASPLSPSIAALTTPQAAAGLALLLLGALVTVVGLVGMGFKFLADAAAVGVGDAIARATAMDVVDAAADDDESRPETDDAATEASDAPSTDAGRTDAATDEPSTEKSATEPAAEPASPTGDRSDEPAPAEADGRVYRPDEADGASGADPEPAATEQVDASTASGENGSTGPADATASAAAGTAGSASRADATDRSEATTDGVEASGTDADRTGGPAERTDATAELTDATASRGERDETPAAAERSVERTRSNDVSSDNVVDRAGAAVAEAIEFQEAADDGTGGEGSGTPAATAAAGTAAAVPDRETRIEPAGGSDGDDATAAEPSRTEDAASAGIVDEHDTKAEEWTPPDPAEFERETGTGGGSGRNGDRSTGADAGRDGEEGPAGTGGRDAVEGVDVGDGPAGDGSDAAGDAGNGLVDDENLTLADEGVDTVDVSVDDDPLSDRLPGGDG